MTPAEEIFWKIHKDFGIYGIKLTGTTDSLLASDCKHFEIDSNMGLWFVKKSVSANNVIPVVERFTYVPAHAIALYAFNETPINNEQEVAMDAIQK